MYNIGKHCGRVLLWLLLSEILCLILAFSFAILRAEWVRWLSLICGAAAHVLLMASCGKQIAHADVAAYRSEGVKVSRVKPVLLGICAAVPLWVLWVLLKLNDQSSAFLNIYLLLNAPYIQFHRLMLDGAEPFSAVTTGRQMLMALPPVLTAIAVYVGYQLQYQPEKAALDAQKADGNSLG